MIQPWDETRLNENVVKFCYGNDMLSIFLKISKDAVQHDEAYKMTISMLETMSSNVWNLKRLIDDRTKTSNMPLSKNTQISMGISTDCRAYLNEGGLMDRATSPLVKLRVSRRYFDRKVSAGLRVFRGRQKEKNCFRESIPMDPSEHQLQTCVAQISRVYELWTIF